MEEQFNQFLLKHRIKRKFYHNYQQTRPFGPDTSDFFDSHSELSFLLRAFVWESTKEGHKYWNKINNEWVKEINQNKS